MRNKMRNTEYILTGNILTGCSNWNVVLIEGICETFDVWTEFCSAPDSFGWSKTCCAPKVFDQYFEDLTCIFYKNYKLEWIVSVDVTEILLVKIPPRILGTQFSVNINLNYRSFSSVIFIFKNPLWLNFDKSLI